MRGAILAFNPRLRGYRNRYEYSYVNGWLYGANERGCPGSYIQVLILGELINVSA